MLIKLLKPLVEKFPTLATKYRRLRDSKDINEQPQMTPLGFRFNGNDAMETGGFEPHETELVKRIFSKVDVVINVGANIGYYVCLALQNRKEVIAFEPIELNLKYLLRNVNSNDWKSNVEILPIALTNRVGIMEIYGGGTGASLIKGWAGTPENDSTLVPCSTMDHILGDRLVGKEILVIVDIEGAESMMLEGASKLLERDPKPVWLVEIAVDEHQPKGTKINPNLLETFGCFWNRGYESVTADGLLREIRAEEVEKIMESQIDTLGVHNFIFYERGRKPI